MTNAHCQCGRLRNSSRTPSSYITSSVDGWMVSPRKSRRKSACFSRTTTETPARARSNPNIMPAGPPPATTHCTCMVAVYRLLNFDELSARHAAGIQRRVDVEVKGGWIRDDRVRLDRGDGQVRCRKGARAIGQH